MGHSRWFANVPVLPVFLPDYSASFVSPLPAAAVGGTPTPCTARCGNRPQRCAGSSTLVNHANAATPQRILIAAGSPPRSSTN